VSRASSCCKILNSRCGAANTGEAFYGKDGIESIERHKKWQMQNVEPVLRVQQDYKKP